MPHGRAPVLAPVGRQQNDPLVRVIQPVKQRQRKAVVFRNHHLQGIDDRIAGDKDLFCLHPALQQVLPVPLRLSKMQRRNSAGDTPVHLFGVRRIDIAAAQHFVV